jgi:hypothetical protein
MMTIAGTRFSLRLAGLFNLVAGLIFLFPDSAIGHWLELPSDVSLLYRSFVAFFILLLGGAYVWCAGQHDLSRPIMALGAIGKAAAVPLGLGLWAMGEFPLRGMLVAVGDLAFALLWFQWLRSTRTALR